MISLVHAPARFLKHILVAALWIFVTTTHASAQTSKLPPFLSDYYAPLFSHNGVPLKFWRNVTVEGVEHYRYRDKDHSMTLIVERWPCNRQTCTTVFETFIAKTNQDTRALKTTFLDFSNPNAQAIVHKQDTISNVIVLLMPDSVNMFSFRQSPADYPGFKEMKPVFAAAYEQAKTFADRQRYEQVVLINDNVEMGGWADSFRTHALTLLAAGEKDEALKVLRRIVATTPFDLEAHLLLMENLPAGPEAQVSAKVILRNAESPDLYAKAAAFLKRPLTTMASIPPIGKSDDTLQLILIPLDSVDLDLLADAAKIYEQITSIPVTFRRLHAPWTPGKPDRPFAVFNARIVEFSGLSKEQFVTNLYKTPNQTALDRYFFEKFERDLEKSSGQYDALRLSGPFFDSIERHVSDQPRTLVVGVTIANIFSGRARYVFNSFITRGRSMSGSIFSYQMLRSTEFEPQSRERLAERIAKELVPASFHKLGIPRATDPRDPYSYSNGADRVDQKSLKLSPPTAAALETFR